MLIGMAAARSHGPQAVDTLTFVNGLLQPRRIPGALLLESAAPVAKRTVARLRTGAGAKRMREAGV